MYRKIVKLPAMTVTRTKCKMKRRKVSLNVFDYSGPPASCDLTTSSRRKANRNKLSLDYVIHVPVRQTALVIGGREKV